MNPWLSWAIVLGVAGALWWHYARDGKPQAARPRSNTASEALLAPKSTKKEERAKRKPESVNTSDLSGSDAPIASAIEKTVASAADAVTHRRAGKTTPSTQIAAQPLHPKEPEHDSSDRQWAEQLARARKGTNLTVPSKSAGRTRTVKTSAANTSSDFSSASSNGGADADDDLTPAMSPTLQAGDVSDMLEPKKAGPSVLRLTEPSNPIPPRAPRPQKEFQVAETKKQRQNRRKNEERKVANEDIEKDRQALLEKQRRAAREARGEPSKNGLQQSKPPTSNAWTSVSQGQQNTPKHEDIQPAQFLLDTFDRVEAPAAGIARTSPTPVNGGGDQRDYGNGMTEEEQFNIASKISEDEDGWNTVATKKGKKPIQTSDVPGSRTFQHSSAPLVSRMANGFASLPDEE